jgi:hypothetical protein
MNMTVTITNDKLKTPNTIGQRRDVKNDASSRDVSDAQLARTKQAADADHKMRSEHLRQPKERQ